MPNSVKKISESAFKDCDALTSALIGNGVEIIGKNAFDGCTQLTEITIPDATTTIGTDAFKGCKGLKKVSLGKSVSSIGERTWADCENIEAVEYWSVNPCIAPRDIFKFEVYDNATLYIPTGSMDRYMDVAPWYYFYGMQEKDRTDVDSILADEDSDAIDYSMPYEVYTLSGIKAGASVSNLATGLYIVRQGSRTIKVQIK